MSWTIDFDTIQGLKLMEAKLILARHPVLDRARPLYQYDLTHDDITLPDSIYNIAYKWLDAIKPRMQLPLLHIYGKSGTGKTMLALALTRFLILNYGNVERDGPYAGFRTFQYFDWPLYLQRVLAHEDEDGFNHEADILIIDSLDTVPGLPKSGDPWQQIRLHTRLRTRFEALGLPTIIVSRRNYATLPDYLGRKATGEQGTEEARAQGEELIKLLVQYSFGSGKTYGPSINRLALTGLNTQTRKEANFSHMWPVRTWADTPVNY